MNFAPIDWVIVVAYLAASLGIGLAGRKYVGSTAHFLVAGRELGPWIGIATLAATEIGTITYMYYSELGYRYGFAVLSTALISGIVMVFVGRTGFVISRLRELRRSLPFGIDESSDPSTGRGGTSSATVRPRLR